MEYLPAAKNTIWNGIVYDVALAPSVATRGWNAGAQPTSAPVAATTSPVSLGSAYFRISLTAAEMNYDYVYLRTAMGATVAEHLLITLMWQSGDAYTRLGAPAGASLAADLAMVDTVVDAVKLKTDALPASPAAVGSAMTLSSLYDAAKTASSADAVALVADIIGGTWSVSVDPGTGVRTITILKRADESLRGSFTFNPATGARSKLA